MSNSSIKSRGDKYVTQRVLSAKTHRVKQLQNQLADAHYHLQELSNENRILRAMQKKHEIALQRYESSNAELPQVLNSHSEEMRIQQTKFKQLKSQFKEVSQKLKERDMQLQQLRDDHQHLLDLTKDRNLLEREKLQSQLSEVTLKYQQQNETISTLQRRLALEAKNFRHQLQHEMNKHKDTRHDLDLAITNADKLSTIIEMKEKMICSAASRGVKSPTKPTASIVNKTIQKTTKHNQEPSGSRLYDERASGDQGISKYCETSRNLSSALSHDEEMSLTAEPRSRFIRNRSSSSSTNTRSTPNQTRKNSKTSDDIIEIAKTVQDGMAELSLFHENVDFNNKSQEEVQKKIESLKTELLNKMKTDEDPMPRMPSALRRMSNEESIEELTEEPVEIEKPVSRGRLTSFSEFIAEENTVSVSNFMTGDEIESVSIKKRNAEMKPKKPIDKYCKDIMQDIEKSSKVIDKHMKELSQSKFDNDKLVQQLEAVDKINEYVNSNGDIPEEAFEELNNNFKMLTDQVLTDNVPTARKRSISSRKSSRSDSRSNLFGDANMSNQDLLDDLLGKK